ncbi:hypothetical protein [Phenylobacterium sp.]|uniref:hypothetical protein n=1 Tax=Phenylobacterium sp. TaxID=1871053 RepID=UPI00356B61F7
MTMYTLYPCNRLGNAASFEAFELSTDEDAQSRAVKMLGEHPSCAFVAVWSGERPVLTQFRERLPSQPWSGPSPRPRPPGGKRL